MADGAHLGVTAKDALGVIVGGEEEAEKPHMDPEQMREWIMACTKDDATDYENMARYAAKLILVFLLEDPSRASIPSENVYKKGADGEIDWSNMEVETPGLYEVMKEAGVPIDDLDLTGFMWGWALNAARRCCELPPVANPAIVNIG